MDTLYDLNLGGAKSVKVTSYAIEGSVIKFISFFAREKSLISKYGASFMLRDRRFTLVDDKQNRTTVIADENMSVNYARIAMDKDSFIHCTAFTHRAKGKNRSFMFKEGDNDVFYEKLYAKLMELYDLPLMSEWTKAIETELVISGYLTYSNVHVLSESDKALEGFAIATISKALSEERFDSVISGLFKRESIEIEGDRAEDMSVTAESIDDFYISNGQEIVKGLIDDLKPLVPNPSPKVDTLLLKMKRLFPQQGYIVNGLREVYKRSDISLIIQTMGCGKTLQSISVGESVYVDKYLRIHPTASLDEAIKNVRYRHFVLCPSHLVAKWEKSIYEEIHGANVIVIKTLSQVNELVKKRFEPPTGKEYFIMSKDFGKLSYQYYPAIHGVRKNLVPADVCPSCKAMVYGKKCYKCGYYGEPKQSYIVQEKLHCPKCDEPILDKKSGSPVNEAFFERKTSQNIKCEHCGTPFWAPLVNNEGTKRFGGYWKRVKVFKTPGAKKPTPIWVPSKYQGGEEVRLLYSRKFAPAELIKKKLGKNFFDLLIVDEAHQCTHS